MIKKINQFNDNIIKSLNVFNIKIFYLIIETTQTIKIQSIQCLNISSDVKISNFI